MTTAAKSKKRQDIWLLPEAAGWTMGPIGGSRESLASEPVAARADGMVWPLRHLVGLPLWLTGSDATTFAGAAGLQLEKQGIGPRVYHEESLRVSEILREGEKTMVLAVAVSRQVKEADFNATARSYPTALESLEWPADRLVLFLERNAWILVATRGKRPVYFSAFSGPSLTVGAATDVACIAEGLKRGGFVPSFAGVTLWDAVDPATEHALRGELGLPVVLSARPAWVPPSTGADVIHPAVALQRQRRSRARQVRQMAAILGMVLLAVLGVSGGRVLWSLQQLRSLESEYAALRDEAEGIREIARRWRRLESTVDPEVFPLEHLRAVAALLPPSGVRLTEFQWKDGQLRLTGEASDTTMAFSYAEALKGHDAFVWEMDPPNIQPNGSAQFVVKGKGGR
ncbi:MAG: hypothetical protein SFU85_11205 [Candidatus Methylacidiphilales bacterium]|nr:hypothetical protein [Candidatus Methylacidiphilales bacterium]